VLGAKIDMESPNLNMRDPAMYRIRKARHDMTGDTWKIYPMYDVFVRVRESARARMYI
jgi:glutaminyl-tRNA synthetase